MRLKISYDNAFKLVWLRKACLTCIVKRACVHSAAIIPIRRSIGITAVPHSSRTSDDFEVENWVCWPQSPTSYSMQPSSPAPARPHVFGLLVLTAASYARLVTTPTCSHLKQTTTLKKIAPDVLKQPQKQTIWNRITNDRFYFYFVIVAHSP